MSLTLQQYQALKADIAADPVLNALPHNDDSAFTIAQVYNTVTGSQPPIGSVVPAFTVWKTFVPIDQVGMAFNGTELAGLTSGNNSRLQTLALYLDFVNPSIANNRQFFDDVFSGAGGTNTRIALLALWKRFATRAEKLFATGTGSDASPATLVFEGNLIGGDITTAWNS